MLRSRSASSAMVKSFKSLKSKFSLWYAPLDFANSTPIKKANFELETKDIGLGGVMLIMVIIKCVKRKSFVYL